VPFDNNTYPSEAQYQTGGCGNLPLNAHVCGGESTGAITEGQSQTFNYTGAVQSITLDPGTYKLETWGAQGGTDGGSTGGLGGYSIGTISLSAKTTLYIGVGGSGSLSTGGYNGGGSGNGNSNYGVGGGGATHIATSTGLLSSLSGNKTSILLVAGGGGGGDDGVPAGAGGGISGGASGGGSVATQTAGYAFGLGQQASPFGSGGGGWYGGYAGASGSAAVPLAVFGSFVPGGIGELLSFLFQQAVQCFLHAATNQLF